MRDTTSQLVHSVFGGGGEGRGFAINLQVIDIVYLFIQPIFNREKAFCKISIKAYIFA